MNQNTLIILLALALFLGTTVEYTYGNKALGMLLFVAAVLLLSRIKIEKVPVTKSRVYAAAGVLIITADLMHNYLNNSPLRTLDTMVLLLGASQVLRSLSSEHARKLGSFSTYMSLSFITLYIIFYNIFSESIYKFDHYFVMLPSAYVVKALGVPVDIIATETIRMSGIRDLAVKIGGPCSGLYSMFLLISIVVGYAVAENLRGVGRMIGIAAAAAVIAYVANLFRVSALLYIGYLYGSAVMMAIHTHLGWIIFAAVSMTIFYALSRIAPLRPA